MNVYRRALCVVVVCCVGALIPSAQGQNQRRQGQSRQTSSYTYTRRRQYQQSSCQDTRGVTCRAYVNRGYCRARRYTNYMKTNCAKSCGFCVPQSPSACKDRNYNCGSWARKGECRRNPRYMTPYCPRSCGKCAVNGQWGSWGALSQCTKTCNKGSMTRYRSCNNPKPSNGGRNCYGSSRDVRACNTKPCQTAVDGNWGSWTSYSACTKTCGRGTQRRTRPCDSPAPKNGGRYCIGLAQKQRYCTILECRVDGNWGAWGPYSACSRTCGNGARTRTRPCDNPAPKHGGRTCVGQSRETAPCKEADCSKDVDGGWGRWKKWSQCSRTCNGGHRERTRECDNPVPQGGGTWCDGSSYEQTACNTQRCRPKPVQAPFICGVRRALARIVGGKTADVTDWPWQVGLKKGLDNTIVCGGSLINREWVVTAAHCIDKTNPSRTGCVAPDPPLRAILGEFDVLNIEGHEVEIGIAQVCMHSGYDSRRLTDDIALLRLSRPVTKFNQYIRPICLPANDSYTLPIGTNCSVTGFGRVAEGGSLSNKLRVATIPVLPVSYCRRQYPFHTVNNRVICAGYEGGLIDSCKGDSGGPFVCKDPKFTSRFVLRGAVSWGVGCARRGQPGVYTQIKSYLNWINNIINNV